MKIKQYFYLMRVHHPIGILLLLWPTLWALWLASGGHPPLHLTIIFVAGVIVMRSAGCVINDLVDRKLDVYVSRTKNRPLVTGAVSVTAALLLAVMLLAVAFMLLLQLNRLTFYYALFGLGVVLLYPWLKRITYLPQLGLGVAFAWGIPMVFAALNNHVDFKAWQLFVGTILWPLIYDTWYAMADKNDDLRIGIKSSAILFGAASGLIIGVLQLVFLLNLVFTGWLFNLSLIYYLMLVVVGIGFYYQHLLAKKAYSISYLRAFRANNLIGVLVFVGIVLAL